VVKEGDVESVVDNGWLYAAKWLRATHRGGRSAVVVIIIFVATVQSQYTNQCRKEGYSFHKIVLGNGNSCIANTGMTSRSNSYNDKSCKIMHSLLWAAELKINNGMFTLCGS
jgi:hypothetical protein